MPETMTISTPDGEFSAYVAPPVGAGPFPAVVVLQEIFGVNQIVRLVADRLAQIGFLAVAPDLFWRQEPGVELGDKTEEDWAHGFKLMKGFDFDKGMEDIQATIDTVRKDPRCNGMVGTVGYCMGGQLAYLAATRTDADASVGYYGVALDKRLDEAGKITKPLLLHIAEEDEYSSAEANAKIVAALKDIPGVEIETYAGVNHAFARDGGANYDAFAAKLANARTAIFLTRTLAAETAGG
jgi:carboxymethylenebutenolidase